MPGGLPFFHKGEYDMSETTAPKRRSLFASDIQLLNSLQAMEQPIPFASLSMAQKIELLPQGEVSRLIKLKIARINYDPTSYAPVSVSIDPDKVEEFSATINAPPKEYKPAYVKKDAKVNQLGSYFIMVTPEYPKPWKDDTEAFHNYKLYRNDMSVAEYFDSEYDRNIRIGGATSKRFFNGPTFQMLYADMERGNVWVRDADNNPVSRDTIAPRARKTLNVDTSGVDDPAEETQQEAAE